MTATGRLTSPGASEAFRRLPRPTSFVPARKQGGVARPAPRRGPAGAQAVPRGVARTSGAAPPATQALRQSASVRSQLAGTRRPRCWERSGHCSLRYPSESCARLAPQRRNSPTVTLARDRQTIASGITDVWLWRPRIRPHWIAAGHGRPTSGRQHLRFSALPEAIAYTAEIRDAVSASSDRLYLKVCIGLCTTEGTRPCNATVMRVHRGTQRVGVVDAVRAAPAQAGAGAALIRSARPVSC